MSDSCQTLKIDDENDSKPKDLAKSCGVFESKIIELGIDEIFNKYNLSDHGITQNSDNRVLEVK